MSVIILYVFPATGKGFQGARKTKGKIPATDATGDGSLCRIFCFPQHNLHSRTAVGSRPYVRETRSKKGEEKSQGAEDSVQRGAGLRVCYEVGSQCAGQTTKKDNGQLWEAARY